MGSLKSQLMGANKPINFVKLQPHGLIHGSGGGGE